MVEVNDEKATKMADHTRQKSIKFLRSQSNVIRNLNRYLESQNLPVRMPPDGICRGLAAVRCKYIIENRESEYFSILDKIAQLNKLDGESINAVNHFVVETLIAFNPHLFDSRKEQKDSLANLSINGEPLKSSLKMSMITSDAMWASVLRDINLQMQEGMLLSLTNHAFSVSRLENGQYRLADPNDPAGFMDYPDEDSLITAIHEIANKCDWTGDLGLDLEIVRHPQAQIRIPPLPSLNELFARYMEIDAACRRRDKGLEKDEQFSQFNFACRGNSIEAVKFLCQTANLTPTELLKGLTYAVLSNHQEAVDYLLASNNEEFLKLIELPEVSSHLFDFTLARGKYRSFESLIQHETIKSRYYESILAETNASQFINQAAHGGSPEILRTLLNDYQQKSGMTSEQIAESILVRRRGKDAIEAAIGEKGNCGISNTQTVSLLLEQLIKANKLPSDEVLLDYILRAVQTNQPHLVAVFTETISKKLPKERQELLFKSIYLGVETARHTDYSVLKTLEKAGTNFSMGVRAVMKEKSGQRQGILLSIGLQLTKFSDWLEGITKTNNISYCKERLKELKRVIVKSGVCPLGGHSV
ncbi:ankyrin repeat-containing protein [Legionella birminghamensis]|uniref:Ankyrin repeat-containing protein n=1 Tax=Legionella birminghamensis TaxID=28083 RepID=A0A378IKK6_9GAMM|nr:ankyrin repeat domain-containing protein [Legionella birminghamensis]KTC75439.1 ankyrin repeat-containing protein [Legionella birminghamensis]STX32664.1 ankyrin repeat-containing protein [Legionella birminghamensis]